MGSGFDAWEKIIQSNDIKKAEGFVKTEEGRRAAGNWNDDFNSLHCAALKGRFEIVKILVEQAKMSPNERLTDYHQTPFDIAKRRSHGTEYKKILEYFETWCKKQAG